MRGVGWLPCDSAMSLGSKDITPFVAYNEGRFVCFQYGPIMIHSDRSLQNAQGDLTNASGSWDGFVMKTEIYSRLADHAK